jgi:hypothetical protein
VKPIRFAEKIFSDNYYPRLKLTITPDGDISFMMSANEIGKK